MSQKYSDADLVKPTANNNGSIDGRVDRLENVLEKLIDRIDAFNEGTDIHHKKSRPSQDFDTFTPSSKSRNDGQTATSSPILENHFVGLTTFPHVFRNT